MLYGGGGPRFRARASVQGLESAACFTEQLVDLVELGFGCVHDAVLASDAVNAGAGLVRDISQMSQHLPRFGAIQVPRPVAFLKARLVELARGAQEGGSIAGQAHGLGHVFQHRVST